MKNSALARVFAIVLAVMCAIMLLSGVYGFRKAVDEHNESLAYAKRLTERIATFKELDEKLQNTVSYDEAYEELEKLQEDHDSDASQHRTDLATYSATKGGYTMGINLIEYNKEVVAEAKAKLESGKAELEQKKKEFAAGKAQFETGKAAFLASRPDDATLQGMEAQLAVLQGYKDEADAAVTAAGAAVTAANTLANTSPPSGPRPGTPTEPSTPRDDPDQTSIDAWTQYDAGMAALATYDAAAAAWNNADTASSDANAAYNSALAACNTTAWAAIGIPTPAAGASPQDNAAALGGAQTALAAAAAQISGPLNTIRGTEAQLNATEAQLNAGAAAIAAAETEIFSGELALKKGEHELQVQLENIWYNLGELDKDEEELSEEKERLDKESDKLGKMLVSVEEKKELQDKHSSTKALLTNIDEIDAMVDAGGGVAESAEAHLAQSSAEAERLYTGRLAICALALLGGLSGFAGIPAAFEKTKKRFWLLFPVILCLACTCACDGINMYLGLGQMYAALFTAIFALIQLLIVLPKKKSMIQEPAPAEE